MNTKLLGEVTSAAIVGGMNTRKALMESASIGEGKITDDAMKAGAESTLSRYNKLMSKFFYKGYTPQSIMEAEDISDEDKQDFQNWVELMKQCGQEDEINRMLANPND